MVSHRLFFASVFVQRKTLHRFLIPKPSTTAPAKTGIGQTYPTPEQAERAGLVEALLSLGTNVTAAVGEGDYAAGSANVGLHAHFQPRSAGIQTKLISLLNKIRVLSQATLCFWASLH